MFTTYPRTNGAIEVAHKNLQKNIQLDLLIQNENFDLDETIYQTLKFYNYEFKHSSTGYTPYQLKDKEDLNIINEVLEREKKICERFEKDEDKTFVFGKKFLLIKGAKKIRKGNLIFTSKKNNIIYTNPVIVLDIFGVNIKVKVACEAEEYKKDEILSVHYKLLNLCTETA